MSVGMCFVPAGKGSDCLSATVTAVTLTGLPICLVPGWIETGFVVVGLNNTSGAGYSQVLWIRSSGTSSRLPMASLASRTWVRGRFALVNLYKALQIA